VPHETCRPGRCSRSPPRICPAQRPSARGGRAGRGRPLDSALPALALDGLLAVRSAWRCSSCWSRWAWLGPLDFSVSRLCCCGPCSGWASTWPLPRHHPSASSEGTGAAGHINPGLRSVHRGRQSLIGGFGGLLILLVVNFVVITARFLAAWPRSAARFTLDALPGKQMSIDADLAAGIIDDREARARRAQPGREIEFFGAMDGASKFVRGDAIAGLIITLINIVGGPGGGPGARHMSLSAAVETYTILTIGDGLVSQMPALLVSTAAGITVTRASSGSHLGTEMGLQIFGQRRTMMQRIRRASRAGAVARMPFLVFRRSGRCGLSDLAPSRGPARSHGPGTAGSGAGSRVVRARSWATSIGLEHTGTGKWDMGCCGSSIWTRVASCRVGSPTCVGRLPGTWA